MGGIMEIVSEIFIKRLALKKISYSVSAFHILLLLNPMYPAIFYFVYWQDKHHQKLKFLLLFYRPPGFPLKIL